VTNLDAHLHDAWFPVVRSIGGRNIVVDLPGREEHLLAQQLDDYRLHYAVLYRFGVVELLEPHVLLFVAFLTQICLLFALHSDISAVVALLVQQRFLLDHLHNSIIVLNIVHLKPLSLCFLVFGENVDVHFVVLLARVQVHVPLFHICVIVIFVQHKVEFAIV